MQALETWMSAIEIADVHLYVSTTHVPKQTSKEPGNNLICFVYIHFNVTRPHRNTHQTGRISKIVLVWKARWPVKLEILRSKHISSIPVIQGF